MSDRRPAIFHGPPLAEQPGLGSLTLPGYLREICGKFAERDAVIAPACDGSRVRWTYADLLAHAKRSASSLVAAGMAKGERVAVLATNRPEWLSTVFGITLAGGVAVPLSTFSTPDELSVLIRASAASILLFEPRVLKRDFQAVLLGIEPAIGTALPGNLQSSHFPYLRHLVSFGEQAQGAIDAWETFLDRGKRVAPGLIDARADHVTPADPAMLFFSSGSTGVPKGILHGNRGICVQLWRWPVQLGLPHDGSVRGWGANGYFWSGAFCQAVGAVFSCGGMLVTQPTFDAAEAIRLFARERINYLTCWPHQYAQLAEAPGFSKADLTSLKYIMRGTPIEANPTVATDWIEPTASYGSTETFTFNCGFPFSTTAENQAGSKGRPFAGNVVKIIDPLDGKTLRVGEHGEIAVKGATLMLSYLGIPLDETLDDEGFLATGDGGWFDEAGRLHFEGRLNDIIKTGGANVSPLEIDAALSSLPGVKISQSVGVPHDTLGEMIVSCVVAVEGALLREDHLREAVKARIASYKVPRHVLLVEEDELRFTGSAKVRTDALRAFASRRLGAVQPQSQSGARP